MSRVQLIQPKTVLVAAEQRTVIDLSNTGARGPVGLDVLGDPATRAGKIVQFVAGGNGRRVAPIDLPTDGSDPTLRADLAAPTGAYLVTDRLAATGAVDVAQGDINRIAVSPLWFGAVGDGVADDTAAIQNYINYCNGFARARTVFLAALYRITDTIIIDRLVNSKESYLKFVAIGTGAGFLVDGIFPLFGSTLTSADVTVPIGDPPAPTGTPCSEKILFSGVHFEAAAGCEIASILSKKFLRISLTDCTYFRIRLGDWNLGGDAAGYAQQITITGGHASGWQGQFVDSFQWYDLAVLSLKMEAGEAGFRVTGGAFVASFTDFEFEGCSGEGLTSAGGFNVSLTDVYMEKNGAYCTFTNVGAGGRIEGLSLRNVHVSLSQDQADDPDFYPLILGDARGTGSGNRCLNGNLYDDTATTHGNFIAIEDRALGAGAKLNKSGLRISAGIANLLKADVDVIAVGSDAGGAYQITGEVVRVISGAGGVRLPDLRYTLFSGSVTIVNFSVDPIKVYAPDDALVNVAASFVMPSGCVRIFSYTPNGVWSVKGVMPHQADLSIGDDLPTAITAINTINQHLRDVGEQYST